jgi:PAS domain S-box-containing protein
VLPVVGFVGLTTVRGGIAAGFATALSGTLIVVTSLCVVLAHNREVRETDRRRGNKRMQAIGQHASDGVLAVDQTGRIGFQSDSVTRIFGYGPRELIGLYAISAVPRRTWPASPSGSPRLAASAPGTVARTDTRLRRSDGTWRHVEVTGSNLLDDPPTCTASS